MFITTTWACGPVETTSRKNELRFARARMSSLNGVVTSWAANVMATSLSRECAGHLPHPARAKQPVVGLPNLLTLG